MPKLIFLLKLAVICNVCYVLGFFLRAKILNIPPSISSTLIILGYPVAILLNTILLIWILIIFRKTEFSKQLRWLIIFSALIYTAQIIDLVT